MNTQLLTLFAETFDLSPSLLVPDATLESLGLDSLAVIEFMFQVEDKFGIQIPDQGSSPRTLGEMDALISSLLPNQGATIQRP
ncbi:MAG: acyl carrier protein [Polaromonas sp.]|nr:acyl carrier protein [Polaromonas sp.]